MRVETNENKSFTQAPLEPSKSELKLSRQSLRLSNLLSRILIANSISCVNRIFNLGGCIIHRCDFSERIFGASWSLRADEVRDNLFQQHSSLLFEVCHQPVPDSILGLVQRT